jgi:hypothetical protein
LTSTLKNNNYMSKEKSELQLAAERIESLVNLTNVKINELGNHAYSLNNVLTIIQNQFDKIRNVPSDTKRKYELAKEVRLEWKQQVDKIEHDYNSATKVELSTGAATTGMGVGVATLGPTAAMSIATTFGVASTGTPIATLSGAAATKAALAWLGGGTLAAGGGGMAGGSAFLALAGPVGWSIAGVAILSSGLMWLITKSNKKRLERVFKDISDRDEKKYKLAIVELNERIKRIIDETAKLNDAIVDIGTFGVDYENMTEQQQYTLGTYVNLMFASSQLLVNPIMGLQPNYTEKDLDAFLSSNKVEPEYLLKKNLSVYFANLLYKIETDEKDRKLLAKSFKGNKQFREQMKFEKKDIDFGLFNLVDRALEFSYYKK